MSDTQKAQKKNLVKNLKMTKSKIDFWSFFVSKVSNYAIFVLRVQNGWFEVRLKAEELYYTTVETLYGKKRVYRVCMTKGTHKKFFKGTRIQSVCFVPGFQPPQILLVGNTIYRSLSFKRTSPIEF